MVNESIKHLMETSYGKKRIKSKLLLKSFHYFVQILLNEGTLYRFGGVKRQHVLINHDSKSINSIDSRKELRLNWFAEAIEFFRGGLTKLFRFFGFDLERSIQFRRSKKFSITF